MDNFENGDIIKFRDSKKGNLYIIVCIDPTDKEIETHLNEKRNIGWETNLSATLLVKDVKTNHNHWIYKRDYTVVFKNSKLAKALYCYS
jgi:hypothetical protein